jgi:hypothetical protein
MYRLETISRINPVSSSPGTAFGISRRARVADAAIAIPRPSRSPRIWLTPQYVKPFVRRQKNDTNDAEAICTAVHSRGGMVGWPAVHRS